MKTKLGKMSRKQLLSDIVRQHLVRTHLEAKLNAIKQKKELKGTKAKANGRTIIVQRQRKNKRDKNRTFCLPKLSNQAISPTPTLRNRLMRTRKNTNKRVRVLSEPRAVLVSRLP